MGTQHPKVVVIGAGSLFFGRQSIWQMVRSEYLNKGTLSFVDSDEVHLGKMVNLAKMVAEANHVSLVVEGSTDRKEVLRDADFVILSFAKDSAKYRAIDCEISLKYGIRMCSGDTIGPGGIFRTMRELPVIMECARDIETLCPQAWVFNYINPTAVNGIALRRYAPNLKSIALCDGQKMPQAKRDYLLRAGIIQQKEQYTDEVAARFDFRSAGVNHFTWLLKAEYDGQDVTPQIAASFRQKALTQKANAHADSKGHFSDAMSCDLYEIFGYIPTMIGHTKEYVRYWQALGTTKEAIPPLALWNVNDRYKRHEEMWKQVDDYLSGATPVSDYFFERDLATDIIENMVGGLGRPYYINTFNQGAVANMNDDAFMELCCDITMEQVKPYPAGEMPRGIRGMQELVLDTHELTVEAVVERSFTKLRRAMMTDPLVSSIADADHIIKELLELEKDIIPAYWYE